MRVDQSGDIRARPLLNPTVGCRKSHGLHKMAVSTTTILIVIFIILLIIIRFSHSEWSTRVQKLIKSLKMLLTPFTDSKKPHYVSPVDTGGFCTKIPILGFFSRLSYLGFLTIMNNLNQEKLLSCDGALSCVDF